MRSVRPMQVAKTGCIVMSVLFCALGALLLFMPELSASLIGVLIAAMLIVFGLIKLTGYFSRDLYRLAFQYDLAIGTLLVALGLMLLTKPGRAMDFMCLILGIAVASDGFFKVQMSLDAKRFGLSTWWLILILGVIAGIAGLAAAFHPVEGTKVLMMLLGASLLAEGLLTLSVTLCAVKIIRDQRKDEIEID